MGDISSGPRLLLASIAGLGSFATIIFWPAGRIDWLAGWFYFGLVTASLFINYLYFRCVNPGVIEDPVN